MRQRETDEMICMCIASFGIMFLAALIDNNISLEYEYQSALFGANILANPEFVTDPANLDGVRQYCEVDKSISASLMNNVMWFKDIDMLCAISYISSIMAQLLTTMSKQNVQLDFGRISFEILMIISGFYIN
jgi:hypothetical protein